MKKKKKEDISIRSSAAEYLTFVASVGEGAESFEVRYEDENIWITQKMLATLYDIEIPGIIYHLRKLFIDCELDKDSVIKEYGYALDEPFLPFPGITC